MDSFNKKVYANLIKNTFVIQFANKQLLNIKFIKEVALVTMFLLCEFLDLVADDDNTKITDINTAIVAINNFAQKLNPNFKSIDNEDTAVEFIEEYKKEKEALDLIQSENQ